MNSKGNHKDSDKQGVKTHKLEKIPVEDVVIHVSLTVKQIPKKLP